MSRAARVLWVGAVTAGLLFVALSVIAEGLKVDVDGRILAVFDAQLFGYPPQEGRMYLGALSDAQRQTYLGIFRQLDTVFPVLLCLVLLGAIWLNRGDKGRLARGIALGLPLLYLAFDLWENAGVARVLLAGAEATDAALSQVRLRTVGKWATLMLSFATLFWLWRAARRGSTAS